MHGRRRHAKREARLDTPDVEAWCIRRQDGSLHLGTLSVHENRVWERYAKFTKEGRKNLGGLHAEDFARQRGDGIVPVLIIEDAYAKED